MFALLIAVPDSTVKPEDAKVQTGPVVEERAQVTQFAPYRDLNDRLVGDLIDAVKGVLRKEASDRLRDVYLIGDIERDIARNVIERMREMANDNARPITCISTAPEAM